MDINNGINKVALSCGNTRVSLFDLKMDAIISKGRFQLGQGLLVTMFIIGLFFFSSFLFRNALSYQYLQIDRLIAAIVFTLVLLYIIFKGLEEYKAVNIYESHLKIKWLFGLISVRLNKAVLNQFGQCSVRKINYIYLKSDKFDVLLNENLIENNTELIEQLREWQIRRRDNLPVSEISKVEMKIGGTALMIAGLFMFAGIVFVSYINPISTTDNGILSPVTGHLSKEPDIKKPSFRSSSKNVTFELQEYPSIRFEVGNPGYEAMNLNTLSQYKLGDNITLLVTKNEYSKKLKRVNEPTFSEKHFNWSDVHTYGIEINNQKVLRLEEFNKEALNMRQNNKKWGTVAIALAVFVFLGGLKAFR